jgi:hypothetical protein
MINHADAIKNGPPNARAEALEDLKYVLSFPDDIRMLLTLRKVSMNIGPASGSDEYNKGVEDTCKLFLGIIDERIEMAAKHYAGIKGY